MGYLEAGRIVELRPNRRARVIDSARGEEVHDEAAARLIERAVAWYQSAAQAYHEGRLRSGDPPAAHAASRWAYR